MRPVERKVAMFYTNMPRRYVDFVLVWETPDSTGDGPLREGVQESIEKRRIFEKNLEEEGLHLERDSLEGSKLNFVKIHSSMPVLQRYAEILRLRMPIKEMAEDNPEWALFQKEFHQGTSHPPGWRKVLDWLDDRFGYDQRKFPPLNQHLHAIYSRDKEYLFDVDDVEFFTPSIRSSIVDFIIRRKRYSDDASDDFGFGIERLLNDKSYCAAYPLHDGDLKTPGSQRHLLYREWASLRNCLKTQPLDHIKEYFGVNVGLYFAWLGYYTRMLIPASVLGFFCFIYGIGTLHSDTYSGNVCADNGSHIMCPLCSEVCQYWSLNSTCTLSKFTYVFDNDATIVFAVLMSFWAAIFLEFWKRYSASITHKWDLSSFDITEEQPRLEYLSRLKRLKKLESDVVNTSTEPHVSFWRTRVPFQLFSLSTVLFLVTLAGAVIVGVIAYRVCMVRIFQNEYPELQSRSIMIVSATAAGINLIIIVIFNQIYSGVAQYLTETELHRTQTEFDDALTLKIFVLQFINYYASIFYIAFFKGRFAPAPNQKSNFFNEERCGTAGCMTELCIQLATIMVGKQFIGGVVEMGTPVIQKWVKQLQFLLNSKRRRTRRPAFATQWAKDYKLASWTSRSLFSEYLEMIIQYGFVTIFVAAFPLAPLFALLNNILEMRLDATKMLIYNRRPVGQRVKSIGVWYGILDMISRVAVISNALIIAFTSNFIPNLIFNVMYEGDSLPFFEHSLVSFNISDFHTERRPVSQRESDFIWNKVQQTGICWYQDYAFNHTHPPELRYEHDGFYWKVVAARLIFVVLFQNFVSICVLILKVLIPDVPKKLQQKIRQENHLTSEIIIKHEMLRARKESKSQISDQSPNSPSSAEISPEIQLLSSVPLSEGRKASQGPGNVVSSNEIPGNPQTQSPVKQNESVNLLTKFKMWSRSFTEGDSDEAVTSC